MHTRWPLLVAMFVLILAVSSGCSARREATLASTSPSSMSGSSEAGQGEGTAQGIGAIRVAEPHAASGTNGASHTNVATGLGEAAIGDRAGRIQVAGRTAPGGSAPGGGTDGVTGREDGLMGRPSLKGYQTIPELPDIHFDFDRAVIRPDAARILDAGAEWLRSNPNHLLLIEGHADERGTNEYNVALGDRRARASLNYLVSRGVEQRRITIVSYGEERPLCVEKHEACWSRNRRAHFAVEPR